MARIAFDIDRKDKREIKIRLAEEGRTLSEVMRTFCSHYKDFGLYPGQQINWEDHVSLPDTPAVYFIYTKDKVQYVGQTKSLHTRFTNHHRKYQFAELGANIFWIEAPVDTLVGLEIWFIDVLEPPLNGSKVPTQEGKGCFTLSLDEDSMEQLDNLTKLTNRTKSEVVSLLISWVRPGRFGEVELKVNNDDLLQDN